MAKRLGERTIFKTKLLTIKDIDIEFNSGKKVTYQIVEKNDTTLLVPIDEAENVYFVKEYFYAIDEYRLGLPKGRLETGDDLLDRANKELQEEIGMKAGKLDFLGTFTMSPGYYTQKTHIYVAQNLTKSKLQGDEEEPLKVIKYPFKNFETLIDSGELNETRVITALYRARKFLSKKS